MCHVRSTAAVAVLPPLSAPETPPAPTLLARVRVWMQRSRQRRTLAELDDFRLKDIGLTRAEALAEARKPFWRA